MELPSECPLCGGELFPVRWKADHTGNWNAEECLRCGASILWHHPHHRPHVPVGPWLYGDSTEENLSV